MDKISINPYLLEYVDTYEKPKNRHIDNYDNLINDKELMDNNPLKSFLNLFPSQFTMKDTKIIDNIDLMEEIRIPFEKTIYPSNYLNGSILHYKDELLLFYRTENKDENDKWFQQSSICVCQLDNKLKVIQNSVKLLKLGHNSKKWDLNFFEGNPIRKSQYLFVEDPRAFIGIDGKMNLIYNDGFKSYQCILNDNMECLDWWDFDFDNELQDYKIDKDAREKNWTPFIKDNKQYLIYCVNDNQQVILETKREKLIKIHHSYFPHTKKIKKMYGGIRGGSPALLMEDKKHFITIFHSRKDFKMEDNQISVYTMGFYIFEANPPFKIKYISQIPILKPEPFPISLIPIPNWRNIVVFPSGLMKNGNGDNYIISLGYQDYQNRLLFLNEKDIKNNLKEV